MRLADELRQREDGFTLVELLTAITISLIVLFATLQSLDLFTSNAAQQTRVTDANDQVRMTMDRVTRDMRGAGAIRRAAATDLVYTVPVLRDGAERVRVERLCVDAAGSELYGSSSIENAYAAPPSPCTGSRVATLRSTGDTAFTYDGASTSQTPALVRNVGLTFSLDASGGGRPGSSTLTASVTRRSAGTLYGDDHDLDAECRPDGGALLHVGVQDVLGVTYSVDGGISFQVGDSDNRLVIPSGITNVLARVTDSLGVTRIIGREIDCMGAGA